jgi:glycopeptide antibiotics resistance protein
MVKSFISPIYTVCYAIVDRLLSSVAIATDCPLSGNKSVFIQETDLKAAKRLRRAGHVMMALIVLGSILPLHWSLGGLDRWPLLLKWRDMQPYDILQNIAALVPVGIVYGASRDAESRWRSLALAALVAVLLQFVQLLLPDRTPRLTDAVANIAGLILGLGFARATHMMRKIPGTPQPIELAILLLLLSYLLLLLLIAQGFSSAMDQWLMQTGNFAVGWKLPLAQFVIAGFVARALVAGHDRAMWLFIVFGAGCLLASHNANLAPAFVGGALAAQFLPRRAVEHGAIAALLAVLLWDGLTPWIPLSRNMIWVPLKSMLMHTSMSGFVTLAWKLFCWSSLTLFLCQYIKQGRGVMLLVTLLVATLEFAQTYIASGFPDITDVLLAAGMSGLVVLAVQQSGQRLGQLR